MLAGKRTCSLIATTTKPGGSDQRFRTHMGVLVATSTSDEIGWIGATSPDSDERGAPCAPAMGGERGHRFMRRLVGDPLQRCGDSRNRRWRGVGNPRHLSKQGGFTSGEGQPCQGKRFTAARMGCESRFAGGEAGRAIDEERVEVGSQTVIDIRELDGAIGRRRRCQFTQMPEEGGFLRMIGRDMGQPHDRQLIRI